MVNDSEGSDFTEGSDESDEDEEHDVVKERIPKFDYKRDEDNWVGHRVRT